MCNRSVTQWQTIKPDVILTVATGCHATLQEYAKAPLNIEVPNIPLHTIEDFALTQISESGIELTPRPQKIMIHTPCTLRNALRTPQLVSQLLQKIPQATLISMPISMGCCGAAGTNFLRHPDSAKKLVDPIVDFIRKEKPDVWVTSNIGCMLYVKHALKEAGITLPIMHPISLIAAQLP